ncbi:HAD family hydrolase [Criibacterium bergeronii]|nr:HAD family hydrolase [Criibacterium bergeronii]MBS6063297.1 HAD family hydrolase [Peptostreptococcaceae bacterium]
MSYNAKYETYIFDLDGTLCDTSVDLANAVNFALIKNYFEKKDVLEIKSYLGNGIKNLIKLSSGLEVDDPRFEKTFSDFKTYYSDHLLDNTRPYENIVDVIDFIKAKGAKVCVASNKADSYAKIICNKFFDGKLDYVRGEILGEEKKPSPKMIDDVLSHVGSSCDKTIYIGDSEVDILTANNSNLDLLVVSWGFRDYEFLKSQGNNIILNDVNQLYDFI